jgi:hypothetical protein
VIVTGPGVGAMASNHPGTERMEKIMLDFLRSKPIAATVPLRRGRRGRHEPTLRPGPERALESPGPDDDLARSPVLARIVEESQEAAAKRDATAAHQPIREPVPHRLYALD